MGFRRYGGELYEFGKQVQKTDILGEGHYKGRHYVIRSNRIGLPMVYVELKDGESVADGRTDSATTVIRGSFEIAYQGKAYWDIGIDKNYVGWDYGHDGDFIPTEENDDPGPDYKYSWEEILMDVASVITQLEMRRR